MRILVIVIGLVAAVYSLGKGVMFALAVKSAGGISGISERILGAEIGGIVFSGAIALWCLSNGFKQKRAKQASPGRPEQGGA
jgi:hypothetical protein